MYCAILIFHALILRTFIEGMIRRDFDLYGLPDNLIVDKDDCSKVPGHEQKDCEG